MNESTTQSNPQNSNESAPGLSIASLVLGIISFLGGMFLIIPPILAIVFGHVSRSDCKRRGIQAGKGMALAGLILGYLTLIPVPLGLMSAMAIPAFQKVRETSQEKTIINNLRQLSSASAQYFLETGKDSVQTTELIGPNGYMRELMVVDGETYPTFITTSDTEIVATLSDGSTLAVDTY
jgi:type IV pilus assembly protein PilA